MKTLENGFGDMRINLKQISIRDKSKETILNELNTIYSKSGVQ